MSSSVQQKGDPAWKPPEASKENKPNLLGFVKSVFVGSVSALSVVLFLQPMIYRKGKQQEAANKTDAQGKLVLEKLITTKFFADPRLFFKEANRRFREARMGFAGIGQLYKGVRRVYTGGLGVAVSFVPTIALQTVAEMGFSYYMGSSKAAKLAAATLAGVASALVVCPAELIMNQQQKNEMGFWYTARKVHSSYGLSGFYRSFLPTAGREGVFTGAYLGGVLLLKEQLQTMGMGELSAQFLSGVIVGPVAAVVSHPLDTYKTVMQRDFSLKDSFVAVVSRGKPLAGLAWRVGMVTTVTTLVPFVQKNLKARMDE